MEQVGPQTKKEFDIIRELGAGSFGKVNLVRRKIDQTIFAMKTVSLTRLNQKEKDAALN
jgi:serine/threonine protein kinase